MMMNRRLMVVVALVATHIIDVWICTVYRRISTASWCDCSLLVVDKIMYYDRLWFCNDSPFLRMNSKCWECSRPANSRMLAAGQGHGLAPALENITRDFGKEVLVGADCCDSSWSRCKDHTSIYVDFMHTNIYKWRELLQLLNALFSTCLSVQLCKCDRVCKI